MKKSSDMQGKTVKPPLRAMAFLSREVDRQAESRRMMRARQMDRHAADIEAAASKTKAHQRSDARWHQSRKTRGGKAH